jgi:hypothetical protein
VKWKVIPTLQQNKLAKVIILEETTKLRLELRYNT